MRQSPPGRANRPRDRAGDARRPRSCGMKKRRRRDDREPRETLLPAPSRRVRKIGRRSRPATIPASASCTSRRPAARASARSGASSSGRPAVPLLLLARLDLRRDPQALSRSMRVALHPARPARAHDQRLQLAAAPGPADLHEPVEAGRGGRLRAFPRRPPLPRRAARRRRLEPLGLRLRAAARHPPALELPLLLPEPRGGAREHADADRARRPDRGGPTPSSTRCSPRPASRPSASPGSTSGGTRRRSGPRGCSPATARATSRGCARGSPTSTRSTTRSLALGRAPRSAGAGRLSPRTARCPRR